MTPQEQHNYRQHNYRQSLILAQERARHLRGRAGPPERTLDSSDDEESPLVAVVLDNGKNWKREDEAGTLGNLCRNDYVDAEGDVVAPSVEGACQQDPISLDCIGDRAVFLEDDGRCFEPDALSAYMERAHANPRTKRRYGVEERNIVHEAAGRPAEPVPFRRPSPRPFYGDIEALRLEKGVTRLHAAQGLSVDARAISAEGWLAFLAHLAANGAVSDGALRVVFDEPGVALAALAALLPNSKILYLELRLERGDAGLRADEETALADALRLSLRSHPSLRTLCLLDCCSDAVAEAACEALATNPTLVAAAFASDALTDRSADAALSWLTAQPLPRKTLLLNGSRLSQRKLEALLEAPGLLQLDASADVWADEEYVPDFLLPWTIRRARALGWL